MPAYDIAFEMTHGESPFIDPSRAAHELVGQVRALSPHIGAVLHIDGNHAYDNVLADACAWTPHVRPGGWIVFDDYVWAFGDGPKRVGDAYLAENAERIDLSFVTGTALWVRLKP